MVGVQYAPRGGFRALKKTPDARGALHTTKVNYCKPIQPWNHPRLHVLSPLRLTSGRISRVWNYPGYRYAGYLVFLYRKTKSFLLLYYPSAVQHSALESLDTRKENCTRAPLVEATRGAPRVLTRATRATASDATRERHERHPTNEWHGRRHERRLPAASQFGTRPADDCTWGLQLDLLRKELAPLFHCLVELVQLKLLCARNVRERILLLLASF